MLKPVNYQVMVKPLPLAKSLIIHNVVKSRQAEVMSVSEHVRDIELGDKIEYQNGAGFEAGGYLFIDVDTDRILGVYGRN